jgi:hypothetical protein
VRPCRETRSPRCEPADRKRCVNANGTRPSLGTDFRSRQIAKWVPRRYYADAADAGSAPDPLPPGSARSVSSGGWFVKTISALKVTSRSTGTTGRLLA